MPELHDQQTDCFESKQRENISRVFEDAAAVS